MICRYRRFFPFSNESQQIKTLAPSHFPLASAEVLSIRTWGHAILQNRENNKFLQTTYGPFYQLVQTCFLENPIGCICTHNKDVNSGGIKYFKGRKYRDFNFSLDLVRAGGGGGGGGVDCVCEVY